MLCKIVRAKLAIGIPPNWSQIYLNAVVRKFRRETEISNMSLNEGAGDQAQRESVLFLRRIAAARYIQDRYGLRCSKQTLAKLATMGGGPIFRSAGRTPLYA